MSKKDSEKNDSSKKKNLLIEYRRYEDLYNFKEMTEPIVSSSVTLLIILLAIHFDFFGNYSIYQEEITKYLHGISNSLFASLGLILAGLVFTASLFRPDIVFFMYKWDDGKHEVIQEFQSYFVFLAFLVGVQYLFTQILLFVMISRSQPMNGLVLYSIIGLFSYIYVFIISYFVSLVFSLFRLIRVVKIYSITNLQNKSFDERANEIMISSLIEVGLQMKNKNNLDITEAINERTESEDLPAKHRENLRALIYKKFRF